ncbi:MAG: recombinase family protein [Defluviitaleaceae bacterium]|nr:recombinase family protein [Defluviitaleaceae bacterium]
MSNTKSTNSKITALYERLSVDDGTTDESNSIQTQKAMLEQYAQSHGMTNIRHYTDDGISGLRFDDRPAYVQMMRDIEDGKVSVCIIKDMSRLGRDHLRVGLCMEAMSLFRCPKKYYKERKGDCYERIRLCASIVQRPAGRQTVYCNGEPRNPTRADIFGKAKRQGHQTPRTSIAYEHGAKR